MHEELKPCQFRQVDNHGRILCHVIKGGDREVSVNLCRACPVSQINCQHLRAGLEKKVSTPITVRFATGRVEVWDDAPPIIDFKQAACAAKTMPITSPRDCAGCPLRLPNVIPQNAIQVAHRARQTGTAAAQTAVPAATAQPPAPPRAPRAAPRIAQPAGQSVAQPVAQAPAPIVETLAVAQPVAATPAVAPPAAQAPAQPDGIDIGAANELIARAKATAERKAQEKRQRELERAAEQERIAQELLAQELHAQAALAQAAAVPAAQSAAAQPEPRGKIIQLQDWLAGQANKKQVKEARASAYKPQTVPTDADGVSDIVYAPLGAQMASAYQETIDYERCVGWTD